MKLKSFNQTLDRLTVRLSDIGMIVLLAMVVLIIIDIVMRRIFSQPFSWSYEVISEFLVIVVFLTLSFCTSQKAHVSIDALVSRFPKNIRKGFNIFALAWGVITFAFVAWASIRYGLGEVESGYATGILHVPIFPFIFILALGCVLTALIILVHLLNEIFVPVERK
jgi:TRAP-type C4-dicarboxylate transport system permease small subunit